MCFAVVGRALGSGIARYIEMYASIMWVHGASALWMIQCVSICIYFYLTLNVWLLLALCFAISSFLRLADGQQ